MKKFLAFFAPLKNLWILAVVIAVFGIGIFLGLHSAQSKPATTIRVVRGDISEEVLVTGTTKPLSDVQLAFEVSGKVSAVHGAVGIAVTQGTVLATLNASDANARVAQAQAALAQETAHLAEIIAGARPEQILVAETQAANALTLLHSAEDGVRGKLLETFTATDDTIHTKIDPLFLNAQSNDPQLLTTLSNSSLENQIEFKRSVIGSLLTNWHSDASVVVPASLLQSKITSTQNNLLQVGTFLDLLSSGINTVTPNPYLSLATIDSWRANISAARTTITVQLNNLATASEKLSEAEGARTVADQQLAVTRAPATKEAIAVENAAIAAAQANVAIARAAQEKTILRAPISGIITQFDAKTGQIVSPNAPLITIVSNNGLNIETLVPEVDIDKIARGNNVLITFDALPQTTFMGTVSAIDPGETTVDGVVNFKVTITLTNNDPRLKSGLTANLAITTATSHNVLILPQYTIIERDNGNFVQKIVKGIVVETPVTLGLHGQGSMVEVVKGAQEGDRVLDIGTAQTK